MHNFKPNAINTNWTPFNNKTWSAHRACENPHPLVMPSDIQVHRQVPLSDGNISETTKLALNDLLKNLTPLFWKVTMT